LDGDIGTDIGTENTDYDIFVSPRKNVSYIIIQNYIQLYIIIDIFYI